MFGLGPATRIYVALGATDMRKGYDGDMMDYTDWSETNSVWKSGPGICSCSLMPEGAGSRFYTGMAPAFGAAPNGWNVEDLAGQ